jgi:DnaK suppressor protein
MKKRNDLDFDEFEALLKEKLAHVDANIAQLNSELNAVHTGDGVNEREDLASINTLSGEDNTILSQQENERKEILHALSKIKLGTFGICEKSAKPIPVERLRVNPVARCKVGIED